MMHCAIHMPIWLAVCDSCHAVLAISRQELQIVFNNLFISCQACVNVDGSHLKELGYMVSYVLHTHTYIYKDMYGH